MISYQSAVESLYALGLELLSPRKFDLAHMRALCRALGDPQHRFPSVLIAGTNGKGSTAATLSAILQASSHRVGLYTSPHLLRVNERIAVNGEPIPDSAFVEIYERVTAVAAQLVASGALPHRPSFFETMTAIAFDYFASRGVEIAVLEVGMGGRLDATNIVEPILCVITDIELDHQKYLGNTIAEIAAEKAGILRPGVPAVTLPQHPQANQVLGERMMQIGARGVNAARNMPSLTPGSRPHVEKMRQESPSVPTTGALGTPFATRFPLSLMGEEVEIVSPLVGRHQLRNIALAITAAEELASLGFCITAESIARGTRQTAWPGRFQRIPPQQAKTGLSPEIVVDVAHNPAGAWALLAALSEYYGEVKPGEQPAAEPPATERPMVLLFAAMADKALAEMAGILWPRMAHVVLTRVSSTPRAAEPAELARIAESLGVEHSVAPSVAEGLRQAIQRARELGPEAVLVIAGSIYLAGEALPVLS
jgi:dihydrofolate synthase / folylpolyglutamate synthase